MGCHREVQHKILLLNLFLPSVESKQSTPVDFTPIVDLGLHLMEADIILS